MQAPDKIYLSVEKGENWAHAMWTQKTPEEQKFSELDEHEEYIRKEAILEWANKELKRYSEDTQWEFGYSRALRDLIDKLNQL